MLNFTFSRYLQRRRVRRSEAGTGGRVGSNAGLRTEPGRGPEKEVHRRLKLRVLGEHASERVPARMRALLFIPDMGYAAHRANRRGPDRVRHAPGAGRGSGGGLRDAANRAGPVRRRPRAHAGLQQRRRSHQRALGQSRCVCSGSRARRGGRNRARAHDAPGRGSRRHNHSTLHGSHPRRRLRRGIFFFLQRSGLVKKFCPKRFFALVGAAPRCQCPVFYFSASYELLAGCGVSLAWALSSTMLAGGALRRPWPPQPGLSLCLDRRRLPVRVAAAGAVFSLSSLASRRRRVPHYCGQCAPKHPCAASIKRGRAPRPVRRSSFRHNPRSGARRQPAAGPFSDRRRRCTDALLCMQIGCFALQQLSGGALLAWGAKAPPPPAPRGVPPLPPRPPPTAPKTQPYRR